MSTIYKYFHVGNQNLYSNDLNYQSPLLLTFSKIKNGLRGETKPHSHSHLELFYFESGTGFFEFRSKLYPLKANDLLIVDSKNLHVQYSNNEDHPLVYYDFAIDNIHMNGLAPNSVTRKGFLLHSFKNRNNPIYESIRRLLDEFDGQKYSYHSKAHAIFIELLVDTIRLSPLNEEALPENAVYGSNREELETIKKYIEDHYNREVNLDQLSKMTFMNKSYVVTQFRKLFNVSPIQYLNIMRIEHAKLLLSTTRKSVTVIATEVGFNNPVYFAKVFAKMVGVPPTEFRKNVTD